MTKVEGQKVFKDLSAAVDIEDEKGMIKVLKHINHHSEDLSVSPEDLKPFITILKGQWKSLSPSLQVLSAESVAELCKREENRKVFTDEKIVSCLIDFITSDSDELIFTSIRAIGNICYENDNASKLIDKSFVQNVIKLLKDDFKRNDNAALTTKVSGLLVNLFYLDNGLQLAALEAGILSCVEELLNKYKAKVQEYSHLITFLLSILNSLTDYFNDSEYIFPESLARCIMEIFKQTEIPQIGVTCLEIFYPLAEKEEIRTVLAKEGACELLYNLIEKYRDKVKDEDSSSVFKMACDLIVLILTGDACMDLLYNNGNGKTYQNMLKWLDSDDPDLLSTGILAVGNFARSDIYCIQMVKHGVAKKLIDILRRYNESTELNDVKVQHALLSTLKNLVIPKENKAQVVKDDIVKVLYPMLKQERSMVVFKLLGTFRMVIDGQTNAATDLLSKQDFIERLVDWCNTSDHLGVRGEVPRIFSWLIKNAHSSTYFPLFVSSKDSIKLLVEMLASTHEVMHNETFIAITLLYTRLSDTKSHSVEDLDKLVDSLDVSQIGHYLHYVVHTYGEKWSLQTVENCLTMSEQLKKSRKLWSNIKQNNGKQEKEKLLLNPNAENIKARIEEFFDFLDTTYEDWVEMTKNFNSESNACK